MAASFDRVALLDAFDEVGRAAITVFVPTARYMLALELKALRVSDFPKGSKDIDDVRNPPGVLSITEMEPTIEILTEFFPRSGADADKQRFVLRNILPRDRSAMRPATLAEAIQRIVDGTPQEKALPEFLDTFYLVSSAEMKLAAISDRPQRIGDHRLDAFAGAAAEYLAKQHRLPAIPEWVFEPHRFLDRAWHARGHLPFVARAGSA